MIRKALLASLLLALPLLGAYAQQGIIRAVSGDVELRPAGAASFAPATAGSVVAVDTIVSTGFRSSAIIDIGNSSITVRPLTRLSLGQIQAAAGTETVSMNLQAGRVRIDVRPPAGAQAEFIVHGPSTVASVRGTSFEFDVRSVSVLEGSVAFAGGFGAAVILHPGGESTVDAGGRAAPGTQAVFQNLLPPLPVGAGASGEIAPAPVLAGATGYIVIQIPSPSGGGL